MKDDANSIHLREGAEGLRKRFDRTLTDPPAARRGNGPDDALPPFFDDGLAVRLEDFVAKYSGANAQPEATPDAMYRLAALYDFENKKVFFPDIDSRFKFCALVFGGPARRFIIMRSESTAIITSTGRSTR